MDQSITQVLHLQRRFQGTLAYCCLLPGLFTRQGVGFILRPPRVPELPLTPGGWTWLSSFGGSLGGSGFGVRQTGLTSCEALGGKSSVLSRSCFPSCKMGPVLLGAEDIVVKFLAWCPVC